MKPRHANGGGAELEVVAFTYDVISSDLRIGECLIDGFDGPGRDVGQSKFLQQPIAVPFRCGLIQQGHERLTVVNAPRVGRELLALTQMGDAQHLAQVSKVGVATHGQHNGAIGRDEDVAIRGNGRVNGTLPLGCRTVHQRRRSLVG